MDYKDVVTNLSVGKKKDPRFLFSAYITPSFEREMDGILDPCYHRLPQVKKENRQSDYFYKGIPIGLIRDALKCENNNIAKGLIEESVLHILFHDHSINAMMYRPFHVIENLPCIMYFHGGAYAGGSVDVTTNICRALCDQFHAVVVNVDYRLAPENPYPCGSDDCYGSFNWIYDHAQQYHIDEHQIYAAGDSAGGNFVINCCIRERELGLYRIKGCCLFYPHVSMIDTKKYPWDLSMYYIHDRDKNEIVSNMLGLREVVKASEFFYLQGEIKKEDPLVSPLFDKHLKDLPPMLIISGEFDYLRIQQEYFAQALADARCPVKLIQYQGMQHAFMDHIGCYPQAEDAIHETCLFLKDIISKEKIILKGKR